MDVRWRCYLLVKVTGCLLGLWVGVRSVGCYLLVKVTVCLLGSWVDVRSVGCYLLVKFTGVPPWVMGGCSVRLVAIFLLSSRCASFGLQVENFFKAQIYGNHSTKGCAVQTMANGRCCSWESPFPSSVTRIFLKV